MSAKIFAFKLRSLIIISSKFIESYFLLEFLYAKFFICRLTLISEKSSILILKGKSPFVLVLSSSESISATIKDESGVMILEIFHWPDFSIIKLTSISRILNFVMFNSWINSGNGFKPMLIFFAENNVSSSSTIDTSIRVRLVRMVPSIEPILKSAKKASSVYSNILSLTIFRKVDV